MGKCNVHPTWNYEYKYKQLQFFGSLLCKEAQSKQLLQKYVSTGYIQECSTEARPPSSNPMGLTVSGMRDTLSLNWDSLWPECDDTM